MDQGSNDWLEWRKQGIGSSDAPVIMEVSPWKTPYQLFEEKKGIKVGNCNQWAMDRGNRLEPIARARYELESEIEMPATLFQHYKHAFLRASMDGWNPQLKKGLEIKCPGLADHEKAVAGQVPEKYFPQLQHQIMVSGAEMIDFYSYYVAKEKKDHEGEVAKVTVYPDLEYIRALFKKEIEFWKCILLNQPPKMVEADFKKNRLLVARRDAVEWKTLKQQIEILESRLLEYGPRVQFQGTGVRSNDGKIEYTDSP